MAELLLIHTYGNLGEYLSLISGRNSLVKKILWPEEDRKKKKSCMEKKNKKIHDEVVVKKHGQYCDHELPIDIMEMILQRMDSLSDHVRMSVVCKSWRSLILNKFIHRRRVLLPWLLLPQNNWPNCQTLTFHDLSSEEEGKTTRNIQLPKVLYGGICCGSSKGWLIIATRGGGDLFLLNPLSGAHHQLPSLSTITPSSFHRRRFPFYGGTLDFVDSTLDFVNRIELSSPNLSECTIAAIFDDYEILACCKPKDKSWTIFNGMITTTSSGSGLGNNNNDDDDDGDCFRDYQNVLFCNQTLYVIITNRTKRVLPSPAYTTLVLEDHHDQVTLNIISLTDYLPLIEWNNQYQEDAVIINNGFRIFLDSSVTHYYLESHPSSHNNNSTASAAELFIVRKYMDTLISDGATKDVRYLKTNRFDIFKLTSDDQESCSSSFRVSKVESLKDDGVLFLTIGGSLFLSSDKTRNNLNFLNQNCIYFADDDQQDPDVPNHLSVSRELGVFNLDDGKIHRSFPSVQLPLKSRMSWFIPNPWKECL